VLGRVGFGSLADVGFDVVCFVCRMGQAVDSGT
jgi:hypothetical protein